MKAQIVQPAAIAVETVAGRVLAHDVEATVHGDRVRLRKGAVLTGDDLPTLRAANRTVHLITLDAGDVHEEVAAQRLARAVAGTGIQIGDPHESMITLRAEHRGLLAVDAERLLAINSIPDMSVWTLFDAQIVRDRQAVAGVKVTPLVTRDAALIEAERIARGEAAVIAVKPFIPLRVGVIVREELLPAAGERFREAITRKVEWFGSRIVALIQPPNDAAGVVAALQDLTAASVDLIMCAGVTSTDPLDVTVEALDSVGVCWEKRGVPAHPGSTYWLAYLGATPILGMASCGMFSRATVMDLLLPRFFVGERVTARTLAALGHGGLLNKGMAFRFPDYAGPEIAAAAE
ncbi:MAG: molybdopterin-binding domain-containing protein [Thermomicrobiales bacterium]